MNPKVIQALVCTAALLGMFCAPSGDNSDKTAAMLMAAYAANSDAIEGQGTYNGVSVVYEAATAADDFEATVVIDGHEFRAILGGDGSIQLDGGDVVLTEAQKEGLKAFYEDFSATLEATGDTSGRRIHTSFLALVSYWADAPEGYVYGERNIAAPSSNGYNAASMNEGVTCIRKNTYVTAAYDDSSGSHYDSVLVGSRARSGYGCMGRCGPDCGSWWSFSSWTKDCMDHDQCSHKNYSSGGSSDPNCGDEFDEAADDWLQGVWRGCRG